MSDRIKWIEHKGKQVLFVGYSGLQGEDLVNAIKEFEDFIVKLGQHELLVFVDARNSFVDDVGFMVGKKVAKTVKPYIKKEAIVGITGAKETLLTVVNMFSDIGIKPFDNPPKEN